MTLYLNQINLKITKFKIVLFISLFFLFHASCTTVAQPKGGSVGIINEDTLYTNTSTGQIRALDIISGEEKYKPHWPSDQEISIDKKLDKEDQKYRSLAIYGAPAIWKESLYLVTYDGYLFKLTLDLIEEWREPIGQIISSDNKFVATPTIENGILIIGSSENSLIAFDVENRTKKWTFQTDGPIWSSAYIYENQVYFTSLDKYIYSINLEDGSLAWKFKTEGAISSSPIVHKNKLYVGSFDRILYALNSKSGDELWRFENSKSWYWGTPVIHEDYLFAPSLDGNLYALDINSGKLLWSSSTEGKVVGTPAVINNFIVISSTDKKIRLLKLNDGQQIDICNIGDKIESDIITDNDLIFFSTEDSIRSIKIKQNGNMDEEWDGGHFFKEEQPISSNRIRSC
ncbi:MAG: hypothetical protein CL766_01205 [Chloroflexi bacterium]|nr:hypothetical protein [Chloroflexota bacterium]|tara:strand:+ start:760 stop:1959 length:1200 start_codon:yes stop_codon:yes gene_type:complete